MEFTEKLAEAIKDFSVEELRDLLAFVRALKSGIVKSASEWITLKAETAIERGGLVSTMEAEKIDYYELQQILKMPYKRKFSLRFPFGDDTTGPTGVCLVYIIEPKKWASSRYINIEGINRKL